jgi:hypothetical protein
VPGRTPPRGAPARKKSGGAWGVLVFIIIILVASGAGRQILDAIANLFNQ